VDVHFRCVTLAGDASPPLGSGLEGVAENIPSRSRRIGLAWLTTEKIAILAPMPSVSTKTAVTVNTGFSRNDGHACLRSWPWSSQDLADTYSVSSCSRFECLGTDAAHVAVTARWIVERLDVVRNIG
jgi:hypothetical protein